MTGVIPTFVAPQHKPKMNEVSPLKDGFTSLGSTVTVGQNQGNVPKAPSLVDRLMLRCWADQPAVMSLQSPMHKTKSVAAGKGRRYGV